MHDTFLDSGQMCVAMVTAYYSKTCEKQSVSKAIQMKFDIHVGLEV